MTTAALLLGAGASRRFGAKDKLAQPIDGVPMLSASAQALAQAGADHLIAVLRRPDQARLLPRGYEVAFCVSSMAQSLQAGLDIAVDLRATRLLIALADMPHIPASHFTSVMTRCTDQPIATNGPAGAMVPACFPELWFDRLDDLTGDQGAAELLRGATIERIDAPPGTLKDYDRPGDFN